MLSEKEENHITAPARPCHPGPPAPPRSRDKKACHWFCRIFLQVFEHVCRVARVASVASGCGWTRLLQQSIRSRTRPVFLPRSAFLDLTSRPRRCVCVCVCVCLCVCVDRSIRLIKRASKLALEVQLTLIASCRFRYFRV